MTRYDVAILGFGPVGATLANLLGGYGLSAVVIEREAAIFDKPRAITFDHEIMRLFQACGLAARIEPLTAAHPGTDYYGVDGRVIKKFYPAPPPYPLAWRPTSSFVQPEIEAVLREGVARFPRIDVHLSQTAIGLEQDADGVTVTLGGPPDPLRARYLLACDGANSFARKALGIAQEDLAFDEEWMVVDTHLRSPAPLPESCVQYCWPSRPATFIHGPGDLRRWEIKLLPGEDKDAFATTDNIRAQLARFVDPDAVEIWRAAVYRFHALVAQSWRRDRVFLLGDAAHQMPPFLGQGLCCGLRDVANLAWKLDLVLNHGAADTLLDSYETERKPHIATMVALTKSFGQIIGELDPQAAARRDETLRGQLERGEAETIRQRFIPALSGGLVATGPAAGSLFVQPRVRDADGGVALLDDRLGRGFLLATATAEAQAWLDADGLALWHRLGGERAVIAPPGETGSDRNGIVSLSECDGLFADWIAGQGGSAVIVRPDRYVYGIAADATTLNRLVRTLGEEVFGQG